MKSKAFKRKSEREMSDLDLFDWIKQETGWMISYVNHRTHFEYTLGNTIKPKKEHTESYQLKQVVEELKKFGATMEKAIKSVPIALCEVGGETYANKFKDIVRRGIYGDAKKIAIIKQCNENLYAIEELTERVEALEPKCTTMDEYIKRTQG